jgi:SAM-dependent methyltransferase
MDEAARRRILMEFTCNLCGKPNRCVAGELSREASSCANCGSNVRTRGLLRALSVDLFGTNVVVPDFPIMKSLKGIGMSDTAQYAALLAEKFDYKNTFHDRPPRLDIMRPSEDQFGKYDFVISSEVLEHVPPPVEAAFANLHRLLKPNGILVLTVPYTLEDRTGEHFPELREFTVAPLGESSVLLNRTQDGRVQVFENLVFHLGSGPSLEMRQFSERDLIGKLVAAGFADVQVHNQDYAPYGIVQCEQWSLPISARRGTYSLERESAREIMEELVDAQWRCRNETTLRKRLQGEIEHLEEEVESGKRAQADLEQRLESEVESAKQVQAGLEQRAQELRSELDRLRRTTWNRVGRKLRVV